jgi:hypothetical protein
MARTIAIDIPHRLGLAEARERAAIGVDGLVHTLPVGNVVGYTWSSDDEVAIDVVALGQPVMVVVTIEERLVRIRLALPLMLSLMAGPVTAKVRQAVAEMLRPAAAPPAAAVIAAERRPVPVTQPLKLFQYWDRPAPPPDVAGWIAGFRADNPGLQHILVDEAEAARFIAKHHGARGLAAFHACGHPAMQADYFRLCAMVTYGGIYLDADMQSVQPLASLLDTAPEALIVLWKGLLNNSILMFRAPGHSFVRAALALATRTIEERRFHSVALATGPGVFNAIRYVADPPFRAMMREMLDQGWEDVSALIGDASDPELAVRVGSTLDRAGWADLRTLGEMADELAPDFPTLAEDYAAITLIGTAESMAWIGQEPADYQKAGDSWLFGDRQIYR